MTRKRKVVVKKPLKTKTITIKNFGMSFYSEAGPHITLTCTEFEQLKCADACIGALTFTYERSPEQARAEEIRQQIKELEKELRGLEQ